MTVARLIAFAKERHLIYMRRANGQPMPWTDDPILREWRFCNVYRELDRVTVWIRENWREPYKDDPDLWFAMVVARFVNWPDTLRVIGYPVPWDPGRFIQAIRVRKRLKQKVYTGAYMVQTMKGYVDKADYQIHAIFNPLWENRHELRPNIRMDILASYHIALHAAFGLGSFMAGQVIADIKYVEPLLYAIDWDTFACSGPGSRRGLNRVKSYPVYQSWKEERWRRDLALLREETRPMFEAAGMAVPHAQDLQNILCEFDKYERVRLGQGTPKSRFVPS